MLLQAYFTGSVLVLTVWWSHSDANSSMLTISKGVSKHSMLWFLLTDSRRECGPADCTSKDGVPGITEVEIHWDGHVRLKIACTSCSYSAQDMMAKCLYKFAKHACSNWGIAWNWFTMYVCNVDLFYTESDIINRTKLKLTLLNINRKSYMTWQGYIIKKRKH